MMHKQTIEKLYQLALKGMAHAFEQQLTSSTFHGLSFEERFGLLVDAEVTNRDNRRLQRLLKNAKLKQPACVEDIDYRHDRGLNRSLMASLVSGEWIGRGANMIVTGPTGCGKTWLACAFGNKACRNGQTVLFQRLPLLLEELQLSHADTTFRRRLAQLNKIDLLILDDFGISTMTPQSRADLLEVIDGRAGKSTIVTSQIPIDRWHEYLSGGNPTSADAILDRLLGDVIRIALKGESMRRRKSDDTASE